MELIIITIIISLISYYLLKRPKLNLPPGPKPWPVVGNLNGLKPVLFKCFNEWAQTYGPIISVWYGSSLNIVVSNSDLAKQVLKEHDQVLANRHRMRAQETVNENEQDLTWADYGPHYVKVRKMCTLELFSVKKTEALKPVREDEVGAMIHSIYKDCTNNSDEKLGKSLVLRKYLGEVALNTITRLVLGKRFVDSNGELDEYGQEFKAIVGDGRKLIGASMMSEYVPLLRLLMPSQDKKMKEHKLRMDRFAERIMEQHTKARLQSGAAKHHFVDTLLSLKDQYELTNETVIGLLWNLIIAGMDTTAIAVEWAMAELMRDPKALQKAQEELDQAIGLERKMTEDDIHALPYLQAVIKEALRLHPPTPLMLPHHAKAQIKLGGYDIPKGATVHVNVWAISRDPENWPSPTQFRPERFIELDVDLKGNDYTLLPFGAGRRSCIGAQLGIKLATSMLANLLHNFNWCPLEGVKPEEINVAENDSVFVTYMATPLRAQPIPRLASHMYKWIPSDV